MVPIYRLREEGYDQFKKNDETFRFCYDALHEGKTVVILPEGSTKHEKRLRPIRKGLARIAFGTYEKYGDLDLQIVPIGVNYTEADKFRSVAMFDVGHPIPLRDYYEAHSENPNKAIRQVTAKVKEGLQERIVIIPKEEDEELTENLFTIYRNEHPEKILPIISEDSEPLFSEIKIASSVAGMSDSEKESFFNLTKQYFSKLKKNDLQDIGLQQSDLYSWSSWLFLVVGFIPYFLGFWVNYPVFGYAKNVSNNRVKRREFKAPVALAVGLGLSILFVPVASFIGGIFMGWWIIAILVAIYYLGKFALVYDEFWEKYAAAKKGSQLDLSLKNELTEERKIISQSVNEIVTN